MISQEEIGFESSGESRVSPLKQRASVQAVHVAAAHAPGALIYDPASGSLRYPKFTQLPGGGLKSEKGGVNAAIPIQASTGSSSASGSFGRKNSSSSLAAGEKHSGLRNAHGLIYDHQSAESSPRCVIVNSVLESSTSTSPSGSKSVSEMDDYSDVKQLITHNRSSSPSDAEEDIFFGSSNSQKSLAAPGFRSLDATRGDNPPRQKNVKGTGEQLVQKIYQVAGNHARSISTSSVPGSDSFQKLAKVHGVQQQQQETLEVESAYGSSDSLGSSTAVAVALSNPLADPAMLDSVGGHASGVRLKSRGGSGPRGSQSHELLTLKDNAWDEGGGHPIQTVSEPGEKNSPLDPILESLMKASVMKDATQFKYQQNQIAEKIEEIKKRNGLKLSVQSSTFSHGGAGAFSFNQTHFVRVNEADFLDYDSNCDTVSNSSFDFNRGGGGGGGGENVKGVHRTVLTNFTKPTPSKWDDAEKWLSSEPPVKVKSKSVPQGHPLSAQGALVVSKKAAFHNQAGRLIPNITQLAKVDASSGGGGAPGTNSGGSSEVSSSSTGVSMGNEGEEVLLISADQHQSSSMPTKGERTKKIDATAKSFASKSIDNHEQSDATGANARFAFLPAAAGPARPIGTAPVLQQQQQQQPHSPRANASSLDRYPVDDPFRRDNGDAKEGGTSPDPPRLDLLDPTLRTEKPTSDSPAKDESLPKVEIAKPEQPGPAEAAPKVCMRDMGTAMTPVASVEPSRAPTPVCARTPTLRSPSSSRPATPSRVVPASSPISETEKKIHYTDKELQSKTRQEILALGTQLGKHNIAAWATKEEEEEDAFKSLKSNVDLEEVRKVVIATRAAAWEEAEQSKYMARFKREEAKIVAWENHEKAKAEAEIRRTEMKIERMRSHANEKLMNKLAATRRSAEELRASAAARRGEQASKTSQRAEYIRRTGKVPSSLFASLCCS